MGNCKGKPTAPERFDADDVEVQIVRSGDDWAGAASSTKAVAREESGDSQVPPPSRGLSLTEAELSELEAAKTAILANLFPGGKVPPAIHAWHEWPATRAITVSEKKKIQEVMWWVSLALKNAHLDRQIKEAVRKLLIQRHFTANLSYVDKWLWLQKELGDHLSELGEDLRLQYIEEKQGERLGEDVVSAMTIYHKGFADSHDRGKHNGSEVTQAAVIPMKDGVFDFTLEAAHLMHERVFVHVMIMLGLATNGLFFAKMQKLADSFGLAGFQFQCPEPKAYSRAINKIYSDYLTRPSPRGGFNIDVIRCLLVPHTVEEMQALYKQLMTHVGDGVAKVKNLFSFSEAERAERFHLLALMITCVFETGLTYAELCAMPETTAAWDDYCKESPDASEPKERWQLHTTMARNYLQGAAMANEPVVILAEVQMLLPSHAKIRHAMHEPYKCYRAIDCKQLHSDYLRTTKNRAELDLSADEDADSLWKSAFRGQLSNVRKFLDQGSPVDERGGSNNSTALGWAAQNHHVDVLHVLFQAGADIEAANRNGRTPLWIASQNGFLDIVKLLLLNGADINTHDTNNSTPVYMATKRNNIEVIKFLISKGADLDVVSSFGSAISRAKELGYTESVRILREAGAKE